MASNFVGRLSVSIPIIFGAKNNLSWLEVWKVENGLEFSDFTTVGHYINFGGQGQKSVEAK